MEDLLKSRGYKPFADIVTHRRTYKLPLSVLVEEASKDASSAPLSVQGISGAGIDIDEVVYAQGDTYTLGEVEVMAVAVDTGAGAGAQRDADAASGAAEHAIRLLSRRYGIAPCAILGKVLEYLRRHDVPRFEALVGSGVVGLKTTLR